MPFVEAGSHRLEYAWIDGDAGAPVIVFLHEGLGSVAMWRDFPARLVAATGCRGLVYSRHGYGRSDRLEQPRDPRFMHDEATVTLPALLDALHISSPILFGHSDGGSIVLLHAGLADRAVGALIVEAPHVLVEAVSLQSIAAARVAFETTDLRARLAKYHDDPDSAFRGWNDIWLDPSFRDWNIEDCLARIRCPLLAIQGEDDEYGTMEQVERIERGVMHADVEIMKIPRCGHSPHKDRPDAVVDAVLQFLGRIGRVC